MELETKDSPRGTGENLPKFTDNTDASTTGKNEGQDLVEASKPLTVAKDSLTYVKPAEE